MNIATDVKRLFDAVVSRSVTYLTDEIGMAVERTDDGPQNDKCVTLRHMTSLISVGFQMGVHIAFSYDESLIRDIFKIYTQDLEVDPDEDVSYMEETAGDMINTVIGNALTGIGGSGSAISITPPVVLSQARRITRHKDAYFCTADIRTPSGILTILCIGPSQLYVDTFDSKEA